MPPRDPRGLFVLPSDARLTRVGDLPAGIRESLSSFDDGTVLTRPRGRAPSQVFDAATAALVERFRRPTRIVDAVQSVCEGTDLDPREALTDVFPILDALVAARLLVPVDSPDAVAIVPTLDYGDVIGDYHVVRVCALARDVEVFQARLGDRSVALKLARPDAEQSSSRRLDHEAVVLERLGGTGAPQLVEVGSVDGCDFLAMEWIEGVSPILMADEIRATETDALEADRRILELCRSVAEAYAALHEAGVVHGDVNEGNVLVDARGRVTILDFGLARIAAGRPVAWGGAAPYTPPEHAGPAADSAGADPTYRSEQYGVAVLLDRIAAGSYYLDFSPLRSEFRRQLREDRPRRFAARGERPWPGLEGALATALSKEPAARYPSTSDLAAAIAHVRPRPTPTARPSRLPSSAGLMARMRRFAGLGSDLFETGPQPSPTCSLAFGRAGIAYFWYRAAALGDDPLALETAHAWISQALRHASDADAFGNPEVGLTSDRIGAASPYHTQAGLHLVAALIGQARSDAREVDQHVERFVDCSRDRGEALDVFTGSVGTLHAIATLLPLPFVASAGERGARLRAVAADAADRARASLAESGPVGGCTMPGTPGVAHGWGGVLHGLLLHHHASGTPVPDDLEPRLHELAALAEPNGRGVRWRLDLGRGDDPTSVTGWCNGSAGLVFLWALAYRVYQKPDFLELLERAAFHAWEGGPGRWNLCCGYAGRAYACLEAFRHLGEPRWYDRATALAERAWRALESIEDPKDTGYPHSLFRGVFGPALLALDLDRPAEAGMPLFGMERWS